MTAPQYPGQQFQPVAPQGYGQAPQQFQQQAPQGYSPPQQSGGFFQGQPQQQAPAPQGYYAGPEHQAAAQQGYGQAPQQFPQQGQAPAPVPSRQVSNTSDFFGGAPTISFNDRAGYQRGTFRGGRVVKKEESVQTKMGTGEVLVYSDGTQRKQLIITLATAERSDATDNGERRLFVKGDMVRAVGSAFQSVGAPDVEEGGWLYIAWTDEKAPKQAGWNPQKVYQGVYARPGQPDPMAGQPTYQAPAAAAPPVQQYVGGVGQHQQFAQAQYPTPPAPGEVPFQPQAPAAPPQQFQQAAPAQDPQYAAWLAQQAQGQQQFGGQVAAPQAPAQPQYDQAPAQGGGAPVGYNPFGKQQ